ncbi:DeoR/GlpR family DNA-binding transcription regulator [Sphingobium yanoikuyae]|uniref:DeoR/GlpR family DNA-binding transcription regulator n=1 Tax=Sphingobium yanoikuyae TaxID=13690 RepID=UPI0007C80A1D|nr:DeoR/GlpR family DNA-binding transcription regulator [Sphingobium yanoikuyae]
MSDRVKLRQSQIMELAQREGRVSVDSIAGELGLTPQTIRKDLNDLSAQKLLNRVHGGAVIASGVDNIGYPARRILSEAEKFAIGRVSATLIPDNSSLFINIGTTTEAVAAALVGRRNLLIITNNLNVVDLVDGEPGIEVIVVGGRVRRADRAVVGPFAVDFIRNFKVDFAVVGASAIDEDGTLLDFDMSEVQVSQTIIECARSVILVADSSKIGRAAPVRIGHIGEVDYFVTDRFNNAALADACSLAGVHVIDALAVDASLEDGVNPGEAPEITEDHIGRAIDA